MNYARIITTSGILCFLVKLIAFTPTLNQSLSFLDGRKCIGSAFEMPVINQPNEPLVSMSQKLLYLLSFCRNTPEVKRSTYYFNHKPSNNISEQNFQRSMTCLRNWRCLPLPFSRRN
ncbi:hypothetical protein [Pedobacter sandarakinus]|uniref:hypothetical protein n=1 Tax=Pedobacter sandarakinus TaxID=353156 RepID=UPI002245DE73|nr:hypothetical protein [Pedobacter sandarakinus]